MEPFPVSKTELRAEPATCPLGICRRAWLLLKYAGRRRRSQIFVFFVAAASMALFVWHNPSLRPPRIAFSTWFQAPTNAAGLVTITNAPTIASPPAAGNVDDWLAWFGKLQTFLGVFTLLVAVFVWFNELQEEWEGTLPHRMTVCFLHEGRPAIVCRHVWLAGADDLRAWGQQVAAQSVGESRLEFRPDVAATGPEIVQDPSQGAVQLHTVRFHLNQRPPSLIAQPDSCRYQNLLAPDASVRWESSRAVADLPDVRRWMTSSEPP